MARPRFEEEFGPLEAEVMAAIWGAGGQVSVREVADELNSGRAEALAYTTVMTVMVRLTEKQNLIRRKVGRTYFYEAVAPDAAGVAVKDVLRTHGDAAVAHFIDETRGDPAALRRLRRLLEDDDG